MRIRNIKQRMAALQQFHEYILQDVQPFKGSWREKFNCENLYVELGTGKGNFLTELASRNPDTLYVGVEKFAAVLASAARKAKERNLPNVKFIHMDVLDLLSCFAESEVQGIYLNFVDPWPKSKHEKRRLTHPNFLQLYQSVLQKDGFVQLKTDNESLFEYSLNEFADAGCRLRGITLNLHQSKWEADNVWTEYETKYAGLGMKIYRCQAFFSRS